KPMFTSDSMDEVATIIKNIIGTRQISNSLLVSARRKLECLESKFESTWANSDEMYTTREMTNIVKDKTVLSDAHTQYLVYFRIAGDKSKTDPDEADFDNNKVFSMDSNIVLTDSDADNHKVFRDYEEYYEEEISTEKTLTDPITSWILPSGRDVSSGLFWNIGSFDEDIEVKNLFSDVEWNEMIKDFNLFVNFKSH
ncbi:7150_t:CDS:2, partial [Dentiscutata erythropus]